MHTKQKFDWGSLIVPAILIWIIGSCVASYSAPTSTPTPAPTRPATSLPSSKYDDTAQSQLTQDAQDTQILIWEAQETQSAGGSSCPDGCTSHLDGCDIKGNIGFDSGKKIYHLPGQDYYNETNIDPSYGERWFCTEEEALANGWRKSYQ